MLVSGCEGREICNVHHVDGNEAGEDGRPWGSRSFVSKYMVYAQQYVHLFNQYRQEHCWLEQLLVTE